MDRAAASAGPGRISNSNILNEGDLLHCIKGLVVPWEVWPMVNILDFASSSCDEFLTLPQKSWLHHLKLPCP